VTRSRAFDIKIISDCILPGWPAFQDKSAGMKRYGRQPALPGVIVYPG
jgi:hypothetical protein